jgi:hypothetical protein
VITYAGWQSALYFAEEDRDPTRNLPRAMIGGVLAVIVIYVLVNVALLAILPVPELATAKLPAADAAQRLVGGRGREIITVLSIISLPPLLNAIMMIGTRILFAMGRDGLLWRRTARVTAGGTPVAARWRPPLRSFRSRPGRSATDRDRRSSSRQLPSAASRSSRAAPPGPPPRGRLRVGLSVVGRDRRRRRVRVPGGRCGRRCHQHLARSASSSSACSATPRSGALDANRSLPTPRRSWLS